MTETAEPPAERPAFPIPRGPGKGGRVARGVVAATAGVLAVMTLLVTAASSALALPTVQPAPAVRPVSMFGYVPTIGLDMVDGAALHCPGGVTTWAPMIVPIEMAIPQGKPNGTIDPFNVKNMPNGSALWYRALGSTRSGGTMILDNEWTQDGQHTIPIIRTGLRSGTYLLGALCATPGKDRQTYPLDSRGNLIGEWYLVVFTWVDRQPTLGTFQFEQQFTGLGSDSTPTPRPSAAAVQPPRHTSGGLGWPGWLAIAAALGVALLIGIRLSRHRREPTRPGASDLPYPVPGTPRAQQFPEDK